MALSSSDARFILNETTLKQLDLNKLREMDFVVNDDDRLVLSWATVDMVDKQGERISPEEFLKKREALGDRSIMDVFMGRGGTIMDNHQAHPIGNALGYIKAMHPETNTEGILLLRKIFKDYPSDDVVWDEIKTHKRKGLSIGGKAKEKKLIIDKEDFNDYHKLVKMAELWEISDVYGPAVPTATNIAANLMAKSDSQLSEADMMAISKVVMKQNNPFAICTESVGREDKEKYERCVMNLKERFGIHKDMQEDGSFLNKNNNNNSMGAIPESTGNPPSAPEVSKVDAARIEKLEKSSVDLQKSVDEIKVSLASIAKSLVAKQEEDKKPEDDDKDKDKDTKKAGTGEVVVTPVSAGDKAAKPTPGSAGEVPGDKVTLTQKQVDEMMAAKADEIKKSVEADIKKSFGLSTPRPMVITKGDSKTDSGNTEDLALKVAKGLVSHNWNEVYRIEKSVREDMIEKAMRAN